ncbi:MAG TPA: hypothetical protein VFM32_02320 [Spongiibacteraceae bacterium]|nr:hypothetical protein [Spongiibacteraceae bacterium]
MSHEPTSSNQTQPDSCDSAVDAFAAVAIIALVVAAAIYYLHGLPT